VPEKPYLNNDAFEVFYIQLIMPIGSKLLISTMIPILKISRIMMYLNWLICYSIDVWNFANSPMNEKIVAINEFKMTMILSLINLTAAPVVTSS